MGFLKQRLQEKRSREDVASAVREFVAFLLYMADIFEQLFNKRRNRSFASFDGSCFSLEPKKSKVNSPSSNLRMDVRKVQSYF